MRPAEVAVLTDYQIVNCYIFPQAKRNEEENRRAKGGGQEFRDPDDPNREPDDEEDDTPPSREYMVGMMVKGGIAKDVANREYDAMLRMHEARKRGL